MKQLFTHYSGFITRRPILANSITSAILFGSGDLLAQWFFINEKYDYRRTLRNMIYGGLVFSPFATVFYRFLNNKLSFPFKNSIPRQLIHFANTLTRVSVDQLIWAPIGIPLYFTAVSLMEFKSFESIKLKLSDSYWETLVNNWKVWPLFQTVNFLIVPLQYRLLCVNIISILWNCYLSWENVKANKHLEIISN